MRTRTVGFNKKGIEELPNNAPVVYKILTRSGRNNYTGVAKRGRVRERLMEHLGRGRVPGVRVRIEEQPSVAAARAKEQRIVSRSKPRYNRNGK